MHVYRPEVNGVVYDAETRLPVSDVAIQFIHDDGVLYQNFQINIGDKYMTNEDGYYKIPTLTNNRYDKASLYRTSLSWVFITLSDNYISDTIDLKKIMPLDKPKHTLDTIWLTKRTIR